MSSLAANTTTRRPRGRPPLRPKAWADFRERLYRKIDAELDAVEESETRGGSFVMVTNVAVLAIAKAVQRALDQVREEECELLRKKVRHDQ